jgi:DNA-binding response OmpR family regulator
MANEEKNNNKKILVIEAVEDDVSLRNVLRSKFTSEGFRVLEAGDGEEGLIVALRERPNLIVLDILMPRMDGITMMEKLRHANEWGKSVPIILLTNLSADDERINKAITENEPAYYLVKSNYTMSDLVEKIKERLSRQ